MKFLMILPVVLPILAGTLVSLLKLENKSKRQFFVGTSILLSAIITLFVLYKFEGEQMILMRLSSNLVFALQIDKLSVIFGSLVALLWVPTTYYAFEYMSHEGNEVRFFTYFTIAMGVVTGIALSANAITLYLFYEFLTLVTFPLVIHSGTKEAMKAGKIYIIYSFMGAALAFISVVMVQWLSLGKFFTFGGTIDPTLMSTNIILMVYIIGFMGYGVKAAVFPFHGWLPKAYVAPTPVTALLHAVAVVKAGVFGIIRLTYYSFSPEFLSGTFAQVVCFTLVVITIIYGSSKALRIKHLKKRLAYSTVSQLSYVLLAVVMMSKAGFTAALVHLVFHAIMKITLFFCAGMIIYKLGINDIREMRGIGKIMPVTMITFTIASIALVGLPPTVGLVSKWFLATAAFTSGNLYLGLIGIFALMISTLLTVLYLLPISLRAFMGDANEKFDLDKNQDPNKYMTLPVGILSIIIVVLGIVPSIVLNYIS